MTQAQGTSRADPTLNVRGAFIRRVDLNGASLRGADLSEADATGAMFRHADFLGARLMGTILHGADLTDAVNLTEQQLAHAVLDDRTRLPADIDRRKLTAGDKAAESFS